MNVKLFGTVAFWVAEFVFAAIVIYFAMYIIFKLKYFRNKDVWLEGLAVDDWIVGDDLKKEMIQRKKCEKFARWFEIGPSMYSSLSSLEDDGHVESSLATDLFGASTGKRKYRLTPTGRLKKKFKLNPRYQNS